MDINSIDKTANLSKNNQISLMVFKVVCQKADDYKNHPFFGINIYKVKEVLIAADYPLRKMPDLGDNSKFFAGMIKLRGEDYIPVYKTSEWLGYGEKEAERPVIIICELNGKRIGLHVSYIHGVYEKKWSEIEATSHAPGKAVSQTTLENADDLTLIIDIEQMILDVTGEKLSKGIEDLATVDIGQDKMVLFADDSKSIREYIGEIFRSMGVRNQIFEDGAGLVEYINNQDTSNVSLVLTDLEMPNVSGHRVVQEVKKNPALADVPVIVHSSMTISDSQRQVKELGADGFIGKINTDAIKTMLQTHLG